MSSVNDNRISQNYEELAWEILVCSAFKQSERQSLNLIITLTGIEDDNELSKLVYHIFRLVQKGIIYVPEARLEILKEKPELVDVYLIKDYHETMKSLSAELQKLRIELDGKKELKRIPQKILIDLKNYAEGKYIEPIH